jgi:phage/plasmid-associated DNA primase
MDTVAGFIDEECHVDASFKIGVSSLYEQYETYCRAQGKQPRTKIQFGKTLLSQGYEQERDSTGRYWIGLTTLSL